MIIMSCDGKQFFSVSDELKILEADINLYDSPSKIFFINYCPLKNILNNECLGLDLNRQWGHSLVQNVIFIS